MGRSVGQQRNRYTNFPWDHFKARGIRGFSAHQLTCNFVCGIFSLPNMIKCVPFWVTPILNSSLLYCIQPERTRELTERNRLREISWYPVANIFMHQSENHLDAYSSNQFKQNKCTLAIVPWERKRKCTMASAPPPPSKEALLRIMQKHWKGTAFFIQPT